MMSTLTKDIEKDIEHEGRLRNKSSFNDFILKDETNDKKRAKE